MARINNRSSWGARRNNGDRTLYGLANEVFLHHTATNTPSPSASPSTEKQIMRQLEQIGQSRFGNGISYNVLVFPSGRAYQGVSFNRRGAHTGGRNSTARSICFVGNFETHKPTSAALKTASEIYAEGKGKWWRASAPLRGHRQVSSTACPGRNVWSQRSNIAGGKISGGSGGGSSWNEVKGSTPLTRNGDKGEPVKRIQKAVGATVDGYFGDGTESKVKAFQKKHGLSADGIVGNDTWKAIKGKGTPKKETPKKETPKKVVGKSYSFPLPAGYYFGSKSGGNKSVSGFYGRVFKGAKDSTWLKRFANQLSLRGWRVGKGKTYLKRFGNDGKWGSEYEHLVRAFQKDQKLTVDGKLGKNTWNAAFQNPIT